MGSANEIFNEVVLGVSDTAINISYGVGGVIDSVSKSVNSVVGSVSSEVGHVVYHVAAGVKRLVTFPPPEGDQEEEEEESPGIIEDTPKIATYGSPNPDSFESSPTHDILKETDEAVNEELGLSENYFSIPEGIEFDQGLESIQQSIEKCKTLILESSEKSVRRRTLVHKLIQLRLRYQETLEENEIALTGIKVILGHQLHPKRLPFTKASKFYCDRCAVVVWTFLHLFYVCVFCDYHCHGRCVNTIQRKCGSLRFSENPQYILSICPEVGLLTQGYRCYECKRTLKMKKNNEISCCSDFFRKDDAWSEPRRCDYTGFYFCPACHWNSKQIILARVIHNWDFEEQKVSRQSKQLLHVMKTKPIIDIERLNPHLFKFVEELRTVKHIYNIFKRLIVEDGVRMPNLSLSSAKNHYFKTAFTVADFKLRQDVLLMKAYLSTCRTAQELHLLRQLENRQHFVENSNLYCLQDLIDINNLSLVQYLVNVTNNFADHIRNKCQVCQGKGFICEICDISEIIFPFENGVVVCSKCSTCLHFKCYRTKGEVCPRCKRYKERRRHEVDNS